MPDFLLKPVPHKDASAFIRNKPVLAREAFDNLVPDLKARAFTITGVENANVMQAVRDLVAEVPKGADWEEAKKEIVGKISPWLDSEDPENTRSQRRAELLLRTHGFQAYTVAAEEVAAGQRAAFPWAQYLSAEDDHVRDSHEALNGVVLPADSPFWDRHTPPWEWGCRCNKVFLTEDDVADMRAVDANKIPEARRVLEGDRLSRLENSNQLVVAGQGGMPHFVNVDPSKTFTFDRTTIKMNAEQLRGRYDAETWAKFEKWAKGQQLGEGRGDVWQWLNAPPAKPRARAPRARRVAPAAPAAPALEPRPNIPARLDRLRQEGRLPLQNNLPPAPANPAAPVGPAAAPAASPAPAGSANISPSAQLPLPGLPPSLLPSPLADERAAIQGAVYKTEQKLGGGVNTTTILTNGRKVVFKPAAGEHQGVLRPGVAPGTQYQREIAASLLDEELGIGLVPATARLERNSQVGSAQLFQEGFKPAFSFKNVYRTIQKLPERVRHDWQLFDDLSGHMDRHMGNYMFRVDGENVKIALIDNGLAFGTKALKSRSLFQGPGPMHGQAIDETNRARLRSLLEREKEITEKLQPHLEREAIEHVFTRARALLERGTYGD